MASPAVAGRAGLALSLWMNKQQAETRRFSGSLVRLLGPPPRGPMAPPGLAMWSVPQLLGSLPQSLELPAKPQTCLAGKE